MCGQFAFDLSGSLVSHSFELESKVKTVYYGAPALITYRIPTKSKPQVCSLQKLNIQKQVHVIIFMFWLLFSGSVFNPYSTTENSVWPNRREKNWNCNILVLHLLLWKFWYFMTLLIGFTWYWLNVCPSSLVSLDAIIMWCTTTFRQR